MQRLILRSAMFVALIALCVGTWFVESNDQVAPNADAQTSSPLPALPLLTTENSIRRAAVSELENAPAAEPPQTQGSALALELLLRVKLPDGTWDDTADGQIERASWGPTRGSVGPIPVTIGRVSLPVDPAAVAEVRLSELRLRGRPAVTVPSRQVWTDGTSPVAVECRYRGSWIQAVSSDSAETDMELTVCLSKSDPLEDGRIPPYDAAGAPMGVTHLRAHSPVLLEDRPGTAVYYVRARNSAWARVIVDHESPGIHRVLLRPGGGVNVVTAAGPNTPANDVQLFLYREQALGEDEASPACIRGFQVGRIVPFEGLTAGPWSVRAERGSKGNRVILGAARFEIVAGQVTDVALVVDAQPDPVGSVRLQLRLVLQEPFGESQATMKLTPLDPWNYAIPFLDEMSISSTPVVGGPPTIRQWTRGQVSPGRFRLEIAELQIRREFVVPDAQEHVETIMLSGFEPRTLHVVSLRTQQAMAISGLGLRRIEAGKSEGAFQQVRAPDGSTASSFECLLRPGRYVSGHAGGMGPVLDVAPGIRDFVVPFEEGEPLRCKVLVELAVNGIAYPLPMHLWQELEFRDALGQLVPDMGCSYHGNGWTSFFGSATYELAQEGPLRMHFPKLEDFDPIPPTEFYLHPNATARIPISLAQSF